MSSSLRNSLHRRNHKERSQLANRSRLGILEKHKDYVLRARDYHSKQDRINRLKQKAADRNKDEFYFGMVKQTTQGGVHVQSRGNASLPVDMVKILKTQDENYVRTTRAANTRRIDALKKEIIDLLPQPGDDKDDVPVQDLDDEELEILRKAGIVNNKGAVRRKDPRKHFVFVENEEEADDYVNSRQKQKQPESPEASTLQSNAEALGWKVNETKETKSKKHKQKQEDVPMASSSSQQTPQLRAEAKKQRNAHLQELSARLLRDTQLRYAQRELEMQRLLMGKGAKKKIAGVERVDGGKDKVDEDALDDPRSRQGKTKAPVVVDEKTYKPRIYKWRAERKK